MSENDQITGRQIAAGRALAGIDQDHLAKRANISVPTLRRMEASNGPATGLANNVRAVRAALEAAGIEFTNGGQPGVRMKKAPYTIEALCLVVERFKTNFLQTAEGQGIELYPLNDGFEFHRSGKPIFLVQVKGGEAVFTPPLGMPRDRPDGWVTENELRWAVIRSH